MILGVLLIIHIDEIIDTKFRGFSNDPQWKEVLATAWELPICLMHITVLMNINLWCYYLIKINQTSA